MRSGKLRLRWSIAPLVLLAVVAGALLTAPGGWRGRSTPAPSRAVQAFTPALDPGTPLRGRAPGFTLTDQFDHRVSLRQYAGKVVLLAFDDSRCTTICPLTTAAMAGARQLLGPAGSEVALLGVDANPRATSVGDVRAYSELHGMTHAWHFLTGSTAQLRTVWRAYHVDVAILRGQVDHTPALFVIAPDGRLDKVYLTQMSYASVGQQALLLAREAARLLPSHPRVRSAEPLQYIPPIRPNVAVELPAARGGRIRLGPGRPRLLAFFASWDAEVTDLRGQLEALEAYADAARPRRLPALVAVDEASVEPSAAALHRFLAGLPRPLRYPVAIDASGRIADGYEVRDEPWLMLVAGDGRIVWYHDVAVDGWLPAAALVRQVRAVLAGAGPPAGPDGARALLAGSPSPLASLHRQAGRLLAGSSALRARLRALRGYPVVVNAWASWCAPCRAEFRLFGAASARYGRRLAFLGVDTGDSAGDARAFLAAHPVSYPSYQSASGGLGWLAQIAGLPTTVFIGRSGRVTLVHTGQYTSPGALDNDVRRLVRSGGRGA